MKLLEPLSGFLSVEDKNSLLDLLKNYLKNKSILSSDDIKYFSASRQYVLGIYERRLNNLDHPGVTKTELTEIVNKLSMSNVDNVSVIFLPSEETGQTNLVFCDKNFNVFFGIIHALELEQ